MSDLLLCPKCNGQKVSKSRPEKGELLKVRLFPRRPYRCLSCYTRFWRAEPVSEQPKLYLAWSLLVLLLVFFLQRSIIGARSDLSFNNTIVQGELSLDSQVPGASNDSEEPAQYGDNVWAKSQIDTAHSTLVDPYVIEKRLTSSDESKEGKAEPALQKDVPRDDSLVDGQLSEDANNASPPSPAVAVIQPSAERGDKNEFDLFLDDQMFEQSITESTPLVESESFLGASVESHVNSKVKQQIETLIELWRAAWEKGDSKRYLSFYSSSFKPEGGLSVSVWRNQRSSRVVPTKRIKLKLFDIRIHINKERDVVRVRFVQDYHSKTYSEVSLKELILVSEAEYWFIVRERDS